MPRFQKTSYSARISYFKTRPHNYTTCTLLLARTRPVTSLLMRLKCISGNGYTRRSSKTACRLHCSPQTLPFRFVIRPSDFLIPASVEPRRFVDSHSFSFARSRLIHTLHRGAAQDLVVKAKV